jgi:cytosine/adenosine deaminase-related metal-dependent hydrolase
VFEGEDGFHAARLTMAEMLKTGTTCFLDPMLTYRAGFDQVCAAVGMMGIRGCLVCSEPLFGTSFSNIYLE